MVTVEFFGKLPAGLSFQQLQKLAEIGLKITGNTGASALAVRVVGDKAIRRLNREHRGLDKVTDVLSFAYGPGAGFDEPGGRVRQLGDIVVGGPQARRQARAIGRSASQEFALLAAHGLLHLLGIDHRTPREESRMFGLQQEILMRAGIF